MQVLKTKNKNYTINNAVIVVIEHRKSYTGINLKNKFSLCSPDFECIINTCIYIIECKYAGIAGIGQGDYCVLGVPWYRIRIII